MSVTDYKRCVGGRAPPEERLQQEHGIPSLDVNELSDFLFSLVNPLFRGCLQGKNDPNTCENSRTDHFNSSSINLDHF